LNDPYYVGLRQKRLSGAAYEDFVDEFITAARAGCIGLLLDWAMLSFQRHLLRWAED
jgi:malate dehydrogenase (oxaloacetate-decarboxylating)(NADP+)